MAVKLVKVGRKIIKKWEKTADLQFLQIFTAFPPNILTITHFSSNFYGF
jgi:hypothetical protein